MIMDRMLVEIQTGNGYSEEVPDENEKLVIGQWRNGDPYYKGGELGGVVFMF